MYFAIVNSCVLRECLLEERIEMTKSEKYTLSDFTLHDDGCLTETERVKDGDSVCVIETERDTDSGQRMFFELQRESRIRSSERKKLRESDSESERKSTGTNLEREREYWNRNINEVFFDVRVDEKIENIISSIAVFE